MRKGILVDPETNELIINLIRENGLIVSGLVVGESDEQNVDFICRLSKGDLKGYPTMGPNVLKYVKSVGKEREMIRDIIINLAVDGYTDASVKVTNGFLDIQI